MARTIAHRNRLVEKHLGLVQPIARAVKASLPPSFDLDDLIAAGNLALVQAAEHYSPAEHGGAPFSAYARQVIRGRILDSVRRRNYTEATHQPAEAAPEPLTVPEHVERIDRERRAQRVANVVEMLPPRERVLVENYYGAGEPTLESVGREIGVSRRKVTEIHSQALEHLRRELKPAA